ncbi:MAG TPA: TraM recognition domain-containing protein [Trebonia sp.]|jgi:hypothetical protein
MTTNQIKEHDAGALAELTGTVATIGTSIGLALTREWLILAALIAFAAFVVFWIRFLSPRAMRRNRVKTLRWRAKCKLRPASGYASTAELAFHLSRLAAVRHGKQARPVMRYWARLTSPATDYSVRVGRAQYGIRTYTRMEDQVLTLAPPRVGKSGLLADRIVDHPGGVVTTSTRPDLYKATVKDRAARGPVQVFNPQGIGDVPSTMRFNLLAPCADLVMARRMATWMSGGAGGAGHGNLEWFEQKGEVALAGLLFAGAITGSTIADVFRWVQRDGHDLPLKAIAQAGTPEMLAVTRNMLETNKTAGSVRETIDLVLSWAALPALAEAVTPRPGEPVLDVTDLATGNATLYLIGRGDENSPLTPLFRALTSYIHYEAGLIGTRQPAGKLDPPMYMALDEVTQVAPIDLPTMLADSAGYGILIQPVAHSVSQLEKRYGREGAATVWSLCGTKILMTGSTDPETLRNVAMILDKTEGHDGRQVDIVPASFLRTLPDWHALVISMNRDPVVVRFRPVWQRADRRWPTKYLARKTRLKDAWQPGTQAVDVQAVTRPTEEPVDELETVRDHELPPVADIDAGQAPPDWATSGSYDPASR